LGEVAGVGFISRKAAKDAKEQPMAIEFSKQEIADIIPSLQKYFREELEQELSEMHAKFLLGYFLKELAPFAYNKGVSDAEAYFRSKVEDLSGVCFEPTLTYWLKKRR
jgi:uncharacterized protein (DUF2164 family)